MIHESEQNEKKYLFTNNVRRDLANLKKNHKQKNKRIRWKVTYLWLEFKNEVIIILVQLSHVVGWFLKFVKLGSVYVEIFEDFMYFVYYKTVFWDRLCSIKRQYQIIQHNKYAEKTTFVLCE